MDAVVVGVRIEMKILVFAPFSAIWVHAFPEALFVEALKQEGHEIFYLSCGGEFRSYCNAMSARNLSLDADPKLKEQVCVACRRNRDIIKRNFDFEGADLTSLLDDEDRRQADAMLEEHGPANYLDLSLDGVQIGRYALYEFLLNEKKKSLSLSDEDWKRFVPYLRNALLAFFAAKKVLEQEKIDRLICYNAYYAVNHIFCAVAQHRGVPSYSLHAGENLSNQLMTLSVSGELTYPNRNADANWLRYQELPSSKSNIAAVSKHFLSLFEGLNVFAYSAPAASEKQDLRKYFGVPDGSQILLATMSSQDERIAAQAIGVMPQTPGILFPSQIDWIEALLEYARSNEDVFLIVRVHPRDFPNKREGVKSTQAFELEKLFSSLPSNVAVNWPSQSISIYDLAEIVDVVLNGWSSVGKEMTLFGIPVVIYSSALIGAVYPSSLNYLGETKDDYFAQIAQALKDGWDGKRIIEAYRWYAYEQGRSSIDISESFRYSPHYQRNLLEKVLGRVLREIKPDYRQLRDCWARADTLKEKALINTIIADKHVSVQGARALEPLPSTTEDEEMEAVGNGIGMLLNALYGQNRSLPQGGLAQKLTSFVRSHQPIRS